MQLGNLRLGVVLSAADVAELRVQAQAAQAAGLACCQLQVRGLALEVEALRAAREVLEEFGLPCVALGCYLNPLEPQNADYMGNDLSRWQFLAEHREILGATQFVTWSGGHSPGWNEEDEENQGPDALDILDDAVWDILGPLDDFQGSIAFEPYFKHILYAPEPFGEFLDTIASPRVSVVMDPPNFLRPGDIDNLPAVMDSAFDHLGMHVGLAHFKDGAARDDGGIAYPRAGQGVMDYGAFLRHLEAQGRPIDCILEHLAPEEYQETVDFLGGAWERRND